MRPATTRHHPARTTLAAIVAATLWFQTSVERQAATLAVYRAATARLPVVRKATPTRARGASRWRARIASRRYEALKPWSGPSVVTEPAHSASAPQ